MHIRRRVFSALVALTAYIMTPSFATAGIVANGGFETGDFTRSSGSVTTTVS